MLAARTGLRTGSQLARIPMTSLRTVAGAGAGATPRQNDDTPMVGIQRTRLSNDGFPEFDWIPADLAKNVGPFDPSRVRETAGSFGGRSLAARTGHIYDSPPPEHDALLSQLPWEQAFRGQDGVQIVNNYYMLDKEESRKLREFLTDLEMEATSVNRKRKLKMNRHKVKKRRRATRTARKLLRQ